MKTRETVHTQLLIETGNEQDHMHSATTRTSFERLFIGLLTPPSVAAVAAVVAAAADGESFFASALATTLGESTPEPRGVRRGTGTRDDGGEGPFTCDLGWRRPGVREGYSRKGNIQYN